MAEGRRKGPLVVIAAGAVIGVVEIVLAISFAALIYGGYLGQFLPQGIGLTLAGASITMAILAWRGGRRGVVGSVQDAAAAVLGVVATRAALDATGSLNRAFLTVVAATVVVSVLTGVTFLVIGSFRLGNLARFIPYPVVGGFLAGTGWLLFRGGIKVAGGSGMYLKTFSESLSWFMLARWVPALILGIVLLVATRLVKRPLVIPVVLLLALAAFAIAMALTGRSLADVRIQGWLLGPFTSDRLWQPWAFRAFQHADWSAVLHQAAGIATAIFVALMACLFNVGGVELLLDRDLDSDEELRDAGMANVVSGAVGGIPGYHALSLTSLADQMSVDGRAAGLVAALVPLAGVVFGGAAVGLIPRMVVGGVLVFVGLSFLVSWAWDLRRTLPIGEYLIVLAILVTIATRGLLPGLVIGLVLAAVLFAVNYGRVELVREVAFGTTYRSNVDRPASEWAALTERSDRVQILLLSGFVFFGTASGLLERIRKRVEAGQLRCLVIDLRRVTGVDASAALAFSKIERLADAGGFDLVIAGVSDGVEHQLARGGVVAGQEALRFEPDLDRALQRCEELLLDEVDPAQAPAATDGSDDGAAELPPGVAPYLERVTLERDDVLIHQGDPSEDVFVLVSGRLLVERSTPEGMRVRLSTVRRGVVGEVALYTGAARTADVVAEAPSVVLRLRRAALERMEAEDPQVAAAFHRWIATELAERLTGSLRTLSAMLD